MQKKLILFLLLAAVLAVSFGLYAIMPMERAAAPVSSVPPPAETYLPSFEPGSLDNPYYKTQLLEKFTVKHQTISSTKGTGQQGKVVYLTIDDGPNAEITPKMLDILKEYNIKATFFVIGRNIPGNETLMKRIFDEGHAIGVHSYTHDIKYIYENHDNFVNEMNETEGLIEKVIGVRVIPLRFPGGSSKHLNKELLERLHGLNYHVYDWTISAGDGMYPKNSPDLIFANATESQYLTKSAILLMHTKPDCINSCEALPKIIKFYKSSGYQFKTITDDTPEYYFKF